MANSHAHGGLGLRLAGNSRNNERVTSVCKYCGLLLGGVGIVRNASGADVIFLQSHPAWIAAHRREHERREAMRRHPSFTARRAAASGEAVIRDFKVYSSTDTPA
jgi:hypothetical protein